MAAGISLDSTLPLFYVPLLFLGVGFFQPSTLDFLLGSAETLGPTSSLFLAFFSALTGFAVFPKG